MTLGSFFICACQFDAFSKIDGGGEGTEGDDRKVDLAEWLAGYKGVKEHGFIALAGVKDDKGAEAFFKEVDSNGGGVILFEEWCTFLKNAEIKAGTKLGDALNEDEPGGAEPAPKGGKKGAKGGAAAEEKAAPSAPKGKPNGFGMCPGKSLTKDFHNFASVFEPMTAETPAGEALREEGFKSADPNGNGLCSLAELENFVVKSLVTKFPKVGKGKDMKEPGRDLFDAFRPCYIRAFTDAKDYAKDTGKVIEGTKKATDDDFVSKSEFRLFCVYVIVYAGMYDCFATIDGGGSGRDANDDKRIVEEEWLKGFKTVSDSGFVALDAIKTKKLAQAAFASIDDNGGGIVLLDEWCWFIKQAEVKADTAIGKLLAMDEAGGVGKAEKLVAGKAQVKGKHAKKPAAGKKI